MSYLISIHIFMAGFLVNGCIWRVEQGELADIIFPVILLIICIVQIMLIKRQIKTKAHHQ